MFKCSDCERVFSKKSKLTRHFKETHLNVKEHICSECGKIFKRNSHLTRHQIAHSSNPKPYGCGFPDCPMSFACKHHLERHIKIIHEQDSSYKCTECPAAFTKKLALNKHLSLQHGRQKPQECQICRKSFFKLGQLHFHSCERGRQRRNQQENNNINSKQEDGMGVSGVDDNMNMRRYYNNSQLGNSTENGNQYIISQNISAVIGRENEVRELIDQSQNAITNQQQSVRQMFYEDTDSFQGFNGEQQQQPQQLPVQQQCKETSIFIKSEDSHEQQEQEYQQQQHQAIHTARLAANSENSCNPIVHTYPDNLQSQNNNDNTIAHENNSQSAPFISNDDPVAVHSMNFNDLLKSKSSSINPTQRRLSEIFALSDSMGNNYNNNNHINSSNRKGSFNNNDVSIFKDLFTDGQSNNSNPHHSYWPFQQTQNYSFQENSRNHNHPPPSHPLGTFRKSSSICISKLEEDRDILAGFGQQEADLTKLETEINTQPQQQQFELVQTPIFPPLQQQSYPPSQQLQPSVLPPRNNPSLPNNHEKCYRCFYPQCDKFYTKLSNLKTHVRTYHHKSKDFKCNYRGCDAAYLHKKSLKEHVTRVHWIKQRGQGEQAPQLGIHREGENKEENEENCDNPVNVGDISNQPQSSSFSQLNNQPLLRTQHHNIQQYYSYSVGNNIHHDQGPQSQSIVNSINAHDHYLPNHIYNNNNLNPYSSSQVQSFNFHPIMDSSSVSDAKCTQEFNLQQSDSVFHSNGISYFQQNPNGNILPTLQAQQTSSQVNNELSSNNNSQYVSNQLRYCQDINSNYNINQSNQSLGEQQQQPSQLHNLSNVQQQYQQNSLPIQQQQQQQQSNVFLSVSSHFE